ncbi:MIP family channel protein [Planoprotostelium fungivorum]|uniref:MIP family channel protein n=1 Tax=Planoprotostelium fungivorum TaxID=1890364 RepID=A0A2P6MZD7_9EUKA|nr:MIP family channel protein [Planoprotostelium fungivorum]
MWSSGHLIANEFLGSTIFVFMVAALTDLKHPLASIKAAPFIVGSAVFVIANIFGWTTFVLLHHHQLIFHRLMQTHHTRSKVLEWIQHEGLTAYYKGLWSNPYWAIALFVPISGHMTGMFLYDVMVSKDYEDDEE